MNPDHADALKDLFNECAMNTSPVQDGENDDLELMVPEYDFSTDIERLSIPTQNVTMTDMDNQQCSRLAAQHSNPQRIESKTIVKSPLLQECKSQSDGWCNTSSYPIFPDMSAAGSNDKLKNLMIECGIINTSPLEDGENPHFGSELMLPEYQCSTSTERLSIPSQNVTVNYFDNQQRLDYFGSETQRSNSQSTQPSNNPYFCDKCQNYFSTKADFKKHKGIHTAKKRYHCDQCEKSFTKASYLKAHKCRHTGEKPFSCKTCSQSFTRKSNLYTHERTHTGEKPFSCETCSQSFTRKIYLNTHERTHTGDKPFSCKTCSQSYTQKSSLNLHERTHTGQKPFTCQTCYQSFAYKKTLKRHEKMHIQKKPDEQHSYDACDSLSSSVQEGEILQECDVDAKSYPTTEKHERLEFSGPSAASSVKEDIS